jgi:4-amino-4-deoxy-L-arabinose transferase-like glycosyltransferase
LRFLLIFSIFTLVFFSSSASKLAPYIQPVFPPLAAVWGAYVAQRPGFLRLPAVVTAVLMTLVGIALLIYSAIHNSFIPHLAVIWVTLAVVAMFAAVVAAYARSTEESILPGVVVAAAAAFAWPAFLTAMSIVPPARSARDLVATVQPYVHPQTTLYSVGQYRETISPYLQRTLIVVDFQGELEFGLHAEPGKQMNTPEDFAAHWQASTDAVAFFGPKVWDEYRRRGFPGHVIAADNITVAVSRS